MPSLMPSPIARTAFERRVGGHILDVAEGGSLCRRARIRAFRPHDRLVYSCAIGPDCELVPDPDNASEVEMRFIVESPQRIRAAHKHRHLDRHGPGWEALRDGVADEGGRPLRMDEYAASLGGGR